MKDIWCKIFVKSHLDQCVWIRLVWVIRDKDGTASEKHVELVKGVV